MNVLYKACIRPRVAKWQLHHQPGHEFLLTAASSILLLGDLGLRRGVMSKLDANSGELSGVMVMLGLSRRLQAWPLEPLTIWRRFSNDLADRIDCQTHAATGMRLQGIPSTGESIGTKAAGMCMTPRWPIATGAL
ncbi:hypothetical protein J3458_015322 [Metarhizium acridum]|uniref:uncharacterized protein n=1 Tax=Metarhizium acridum TaxID=92637 RepID=UPI001C6C70BE|nr:hypothetical protein J3458_015322 [Metarhizium acridum]